MADVRSIIMFLLALQCLSVLRSEAVRTTKPHIVAILADDYGWAEVGWHRPKGYKEVKTPNMDQLVATGIEMNRHYVYQVCSPTRSAAQSGRNPIHVNDVNLDPNNYNPKDPISGMSGIPRNMTGIGEVMKRGGYKTHFFGKWDCGMATTRHTPQGRGYDTSMFYFHHMEDYWQNWFQNSNGNTNFFPDCKEKYPNVQIRDLWKQNETYSGPARTSINMSQSCSVGVFDLCTNVDQCHPWPGYPGDQASGCTNVDETFTGEVLNVISKHDPSDPLFLFWAPHALHSPLQVPSKYYNDPDLMNIDDWRRHIYHAMAYFMDDKIGDVIDMLKDKSLYDDTIIFFSSDNGGPIYDNGAAGSNNFPLKGGKASPWEGGIRVNGFISGGFLPPSRQGIKLDGLSTIWDWYATFASLGGISDITDHAAAEAGLPPVDSIDLSSYIMGTKETSPRQHIFVGVQGVILANGTQLWKRLEGAIPMSGWTGPVCPNKTFVTPGKSICQPFCLYRIDTDESEYTNLANIASDKYPQIVNETEALLTKARQSHFNPNRGPQDGQSCLTAMEKYNGFWGPWIA
eukprot:m.96923 g.96923  ORF g.96923 m.96923 type:complete len:570 (+) comp13570_c0_seq7:39-1748(+)